MESTAITQNYICQLSFEYSDSLGYLFSIENQENVICLKVNTANLWQKIFAVGHLGDFQLPIAERTQFLCFLYCTTVNPAAIQVRRRLIHLLAGA